MFNKFFKKDMNDQNNNGSYMSKYLRFTSKVSGSVGIIFASALAIYTAYVELKGSNKNDGSRDFRKESRNQNKY